MLILLLPLLAGRMAGSANPELETWEFPEGKSSPPPVLLWGLSSSQPLFTPLDFWRLSEQILPHLEDLRFFQRADVAPVE